MDASAELALVGDLVAAECITRYETETGARAPLEETPAIRGAAGALGEPWRSALLAAIGIAQETKREQTKT